MTLLQVAVEPPPAADCSMYHTAACERIRGGACMVGMPLLDGSYAGRSDLGT